MKKIINFLLTLVILGLIGFGIYKVFFSGEKLNSFFDREVTLSVWDQVTVSSEVTVKLISIDDNRCKEDDCDREGQFVAKFLVLNSKKMAYIEVGSLDPEPTKIDKLSIEYIVELTNVSEDGKSVTIKVNKG